MKPITLSRTLFTCTLLSLFASCNNHPPADNDTGTVTETPVSVDYTVSGSDSSIQLQFSNYKLHQDSFRLLLNGHAASYRLVSESVLTITADSAKAGANTLQFIYGSGPSTDTISKPYVNTLNLQYEVVNTYQHHPQYFTQGLLFDQKGNLVESTGLTGQSKILFYRKSNTDFIPVDSIMNQDNEFGEGIVILNGQIIQLLWKNMYIKLYDQQTRKLIRNIEYSKEGWGICTDGKSIYTSDGTGNIHKIDISTNPAGIVQSIPIRDDRGIIANINELEWINGYIFANIWQSALIYVIDPVSGSVIGKIDCLPLFLKEEALNRGGIDVLNGIAYNPTKKTLLITGKNWAHFYEIKLKQIL